MKKLFGLMLVIGIFSLQGVRPLAAPSSFTVFFNDLAGFNAAAGSPQQLITFDGMTPNTDISGRAIAGLTFNLGNQPAPSAPLTVVRGVDTFTPPGFSGVIDPTTNKLFPTSGDNVLSPGGLELASGPNPLLENDDLELDFISPVSAVGFDILFQSLDCCSFVGITVFGPSGEILYANPMIPSGTGAGGDPGGSIFVGFVSSSTNIAKIVVDESDDNSIFPDSNIGYDTFRFRSPFDICLQDDSSGDTLQLDSTTGAYFFNHCGGLTLRETGSVTVKGSIITLQEDRVGLRVLARIDQSVKKGTASIHFLSSGTTFTITDRNTANNTCVCP